jgi:hydroxylamine reductase
MPEITKDTVIGELLRAMPRSAEILQQSGMHCVYCPSAARESLEEACMVHGMDCDTLIDELNAERELGI